MKSINTLLLFVFLVMNTFASEKQTSPVKSIKPENLQYDVFFQWGFIWKKAGSANLSLIPTAFDGEPAYKMMLTGKTTPFFDKVTRVRDTLMTFSNADLVPIFNEKTLYEGDYRAKDLLTYKHHPEKTVGQVRIFRSGTLRLDTTISVKGKAFDMISIVYYLRSLDIAKLKPGDIITTNVFSGRHAYKMQFQYMADKTYKTPSNKVYDCYYFKMLFYDKNGKLNKNDEMEIWLSKDEQKTPIHMAGKLKIGYLRSIIKD
ncbi:MAG: DUF3108 domain-containing protein [Bacteroidales bacterium]